jgi:hypothetical protein
MKAMGTMFEKGDRAKYFEFPSAVYATWPYDKVTKNGKTVGDIPLNKDANHDIPPSLVVMRGVYFKRNDFPSNRNVSVAFSVQPYLRQWPRSRLTGE